MPDGSVPEFQHVALCYEEGPITIRTPQDPVSVLEFDASLEKSEWPSKYSVQIVGQMMIRGRSLNWEARARIIRVAEKLVWPKRNLLNLIGPPDCKLGMDPYKYVGPDPIRPGATKIRLTCATFVEYCYEQAGFDVVNDGPKGDNLPKVWWGKKEFRRLFPGYQIKAFQLDKSPLDLNELKKKGDDPANFQKWCPSCSNSINGELPPKGGGFLSV